ncbi:recombinase family protein [Sphingomonas faeni]|uniref:recombinase family protein n=1 Tax=Sphingomonas faeni TaxID=185950 RepID=UPI003EBEE2BD
MICPSSLGSRWRLGRECLPMGKRTNGESIGVNRLCAVLITTSGGMLVFNIFGSLAQFERDLIRARTNAGLKAARERGSLGGRRPVITPTKLRKAPDHIAAGLTVQEAATRLKVGKTALYKALDGAAVKATA